MQQIASHNAPSPAIVTPHFVFGALIWLLVSVLILLYPEAFTMHYFNPKLLAITHLLVLGWVTMIIFGALYQLIPVIFETRLFSEKMAVISFVMLAAGSLLLAVVFWQFSLDWLLYAAAAPVLAAVLLFLINVLVTANRSGKSNMHKDFIVTASVWLLFTVLAGITAALNLKWAFIPTDHLYWLKFHAHAGIAGWFILLIMGVSSKLLPMFMVSHHLSAWKLKVAYYAFNIGLIAGLFALITERYVVLVSAVAGALTGLISFLWYLAEAYKKRIKKQLDTGMKQSVFSLLTILPAIAVLVLLLVDSEDIKQINSRLSVAYGSLLIIGFISLLILGQTYKTLPFITWLKVYRTRIGKGKTPFPADLYSRQVARLQFMSFIAGMVLLLTGVFVSRETIVQVGGGLFTASALAYNYNVLKIVTHKPVADN